MAYRRLENGAGVTLAPEAARASVIWLHGLGADGNDFVPLVPELRLAPALGVRFVFPHAAVRPVTINNGYSMRAWYDIKSLDAKGRADAPGLEESVGMITALVDAERAEGIDSGRIAIAGFSQGGAIALHAALRYPHRLAGLLALSTYLPCANELELQLSEHNRAIPILMCHGTRDPVVVPAMGLAGRDWLTERKYAVDWREYPMAHEVSRPEVDDISASLQRWLA